jgi:autotransporter adhesin
VTLVGGAPGTVGLHNVADGIIAAGSTDAVNGGQLLTTNQAVTAAQTTADNALAIANNSVQYDRSFAYVGDVQQRRVRDRSA